MLDEKTLKILSRYVWFGDKEELVKNEPFKVVAYAMRYADLDVYPLLYSLGEENLRETLRVALPGWFDKKSWNFWCIVLGVKFEFPKRSVR